MKLLKHHILIIVITFFVVNIHAQKVYVTKTGEKYHKSNCRYLKQSKKEIKLKDAVNTGYEACKVCKPVKKVTVNNNSTRSTTTTKSTATQCTGRTKSGKRCKRKTKSANGRCYQH